MKGSKILFEPARGGGNNEVRHFLQTLPPTKLSSPQGAETSGKKAQKRLFKSYVPRDALSWCRTKGSDEPAPLGYFAYGSCRA